MSPRDAIAVPDDDFRLLVGTLPEPLQAAVRELPPGEVLEVVMDLGRSPEARLTGRVVRLSESAVTRKDLEHVLAQVGTVSEDNRAGIERTLHRVSAIRNRQGKVVGLTLRVGRAIYGTIDMLKDLIGTGLNILLLGRPGVGKTTKLREVARVLADDLGKRVMVVDTSNEIGGDGDIPHPGIGGARRMQVSRPDRQHDVMIEAVENHMPEAIIVDEIGTSAEASAARTIAERGVQLVATAHGNTLENLVLNPTLSDLVGGVHTVTLSDEEARRRHTQKTINERRAPPTFDVVVEMVSRDEVLVHRDTAQSVDRLLAGENVGGERRQLVGGQVEVKEEPQAVAPLPARPGRPTEPPSREGVAAPRREPGLRQGTARVYAHATSRDLLERVLRDLGADARVVGRLENADVIITLRSRANDPKLRKVSEKSGARVLAIKRNSSSEMRRVLRDAFLLAEGMDEDLVREAVLEAEHAIQRVLSESVVVPLAPRPPRLRKLQHRLVSRYHLETVSHGSEPQRHLVIYPLGALVDLPRDREVEGAEGAEGLA
ncbi:R3H domain-containing nucleic acid-binding protein [Vitiosangium sp. GDMCC 1.1324]|uniref:R3H domain-containing nucleic acid-binding protein n=1 Tax=Vitiosangium sp. (strain GDMCC 1.1324) TaxID=2138576 RepID=UPI000D38846A|nr:R3H domain-containing nucleic acid-binding protein [Vitiosangium sp. GDMCC 1.1324]PTL79310.1 AAA family ATPase [Vitiosangium sp. GDMCC 1.1324]